MNNFYVTLDSGASSNFFPNNKISDFRNKLSNQIKLEHDQYEVALVECSYIHSDAVIIDGELLFRSKTSYPSVSTGKQHVYTKGHAKGNIKTAKELLAQLTEEHQDIQYTLSNDGFVQFKILKGPSIHVEFSKKVAAVIGLDSTVLESIQLGNKNSTQKKFLSEDEQFAMHRARNRLHLSAGQIRLFVYCDVISPQYVGDTMAPLLRCFMYAGKRKHDESVTRSFDHIQYLSVKYPEFEMIHVWLKTECGDPILFETGTFSCTLHFRRKKF
jgi:hypothetical protein